MNVNYKFQHYQAIHGITNFNCQFLNGQFCSRYLSRLSIRNITKLGDVLDFRLLFW